MVKKRLLRVTLKKLQLKPLECQRFPPLQYLFLTRVTCTLLQTLLLLHTPTSFSLNNQFFFRFLLSPSFEKF